MGLILRLLSAIVVGFFWTGTSTQASQQQRRICYFSLNNDREFKAFQKQYESVPNLEIIELMPVAGRDPLQSLRDGIDNLRATDPGNPHCDGLVLSGHHNGKWFGARARGSLDLSALEELKCDPRYRPFFDHVQTLWMQGCNTMDEDQGATVDPPSVAASTSPPSDTQNFPHRSRADYNVSERYESLFENSTQYAWKGIAPGVASGSPDSMILFMEGFATQSEDQAALIATLRSSELELKGVGANEISRILPEIFGGCTDPQSRWKDPQDALFKNPRHPSDHRRPSAQLALSDRHPGSPPPPICELHATPTPSAQALTTMTESPRNIEASLPALTEQLLKQKAQKRTDQLKSSRKAISKNGKIIPYLKERSRDPAASPTDRLEAIQQLQLFTGSAAPQEMLQEMEQSLERGLSGLGAKPTEEELLNQLRLADKANQYGLMTEARWETLAGSLSELPLSSNPVYTEIATHGAAMILENSPNELNPALRALLGRKSSPSAMPPSSGPPAIAAEEKPVSLSPIQETPKKTEVQPQVVPKKPVRPTPKSLATPLPVTPTPPKPNPAASSPPSTPPVVPKTSASPQPRDRGGVCRARPEFKFNGFPAFSRETPRDAQCACETRGCGNLFLCRSPGNQPLGTDRCMVAYQNGYAARGLSLGNAPELCPNGCRIERVCTLNSWTQTHVWPHLKFGDWFCSKITTESGCTQYLSCRWWP